MVNVYVSKLTSRVDYSIRLIFETILKTKVVFHTHFDSFVESTGIRLNYSNETFDNALTIRPHHLLFEESIKEQLIEIFTWETEPAFFKTSDLQISFDLFAASFFLVSRYEEYIPTQLDEHNRFRAEDSTAFKFNFLQKPIVNRWALALAAIIESQFEGCKFEKPTFGYIPTIDIDNAYAFRNKGIFRTLLSTARDLTHLNFTNIYHRIAVLCFNASDPYNTYNQLDSIFKKFNLSPIYFFLLADKGKYDRGISVQNKNFRKLIRQIAEKQAIGIHPSYRSAQDKLLLANEISNLSKITSLDIKRSRNHFLRLTFPDSYRYLLENNIAEDYTLGYSTHPGFRASICTPFNYFDLEANKTTHLLLFPFCVMDGSVREYCKNNIVKSHSLILELIDEVETVGGLFISVWHNESLSNLGRWLNWVQVYEEMTKIAKSKIETNCTFTHG